MPDDPVGGAITTMRPTHGVNAQAMSDQRLCAMAPKKSGAAGGEDSGGPGEAGGKRKIHLAHVVRCPTPRHDAAADARAAPMIACVRGYTRMIVHHVIFDHDVYPEIGATCKEARQSIA